MELATLLTRCSNTHTHTRHVLSRDCAGQGPGTWAGPGEGATALHGTGPSPWYAEGWTGACGGSEISSPRLLSLEHGRLDGGAQRATSCLRVASVPPGRALRHGHCTSYRHPRALRDPGELPALLKATPRPSRFVKVHGMVTSDL